MIDINEMFFTGSEYCITSQNIKEAAKIFSHKGMKHSPISSLNGYTRVVVKQVQHQSKLVCDQSKTHDIGNNAHRQPHQHNMLQNVFEASSLVPRRWRETVPFKFEYLSATES